ncbi:MAG: hypothetical protein QOJ09_1815, partial [Actinomycetota bacterium]|nr:hypothetical protein [Actinomycetota bacterium]
TRRRDLPDAIAYLREQRAEAGIDQPIDIGANAVVGTGPAEETAAYLESLRALGVTNVQLSFRAVSCDDLVTQIERFGTEVAPLL